MNQTRRSPLVLPLALLAASALALLTGVALAGWMEHGTAIFLSLAESGMAWCL